MMKKISFLLGLIIFSCSTPSITAQTNIDSLLKDTLRIVSGVMYRDYLNADSLPKDPLMTDWKRPSPIHNYNLSFLLQEDSCYDFYVYHIISLPSGHIIKALTEIDSFIIPVYIVASKNHPCSKIIQKKIKENEIYQLRLHRYFLRPPFVNIETGHVVDIMLGNKTISINENGDYTYLFTSIDMAGLYQIKKGEANRRKQEFQEEEINLTNSIFPFLEYISYRKYSNDLFDIVDTLQLKNSLSRYGKFFWHQHPSDIYYPEKRFEWNLDYPPEKHDWLNKEGLGGITGLNPKKYDEIFWGMLKEQYRLPIDSQYVDKDFLYSSIQLKLLCYSRQKIYTVQVIWKLPNVKKTFVAIINIQKGKNGYKIIGFNKPYRGYRIYLEENEQFVPFK